MKLTSKEAAALNSALTTLTTAIVDVRFKLFSTGVVSGLTAGLAAANGNYVQQLELVNGDYEYRSSTHKIIWSTAAGNNWGLFLIGDPDDGGHLLATGTVTTGGRPWDAVWTGASGMVVTRTMQECLAELQAFQTSCNVAIQTVPFSKSRSSAADGTTLGGAELQRQLADEGFDEAVTSAGSGLHR